MLTYTIPNLDDVCVPSGNGTYVAQVGNPSNNYTCGAHAAPAARLGPALLSLDTGVPLCVWHFSACSVLLRHFEGSLILYCYEVAEVITHRGLRWAQTNI